jgi:hypothetical protein
MTKFTCMFCKEVPVEEDNMICGKCAEEEAIAQERDEQYANYHHEQQRIRYADIQLFDNEVGKISVTYCRKVLCTWNYRTFDHLNEQTQRDAMLTAKGYIEGWCDAVAALKRMLR